MSPSTIALLGAGFLRAKIGARSIGAEGIGLYGQVLTATLLSISVSSLGMPTGLTQRITESRSKGRTDLISEYLSTALFITAGLTVLWVLLALGSAGWIASRILGDRSHAVLVAIGALSLLPMALSSCILNPVLLGTLEYRRYSWARMASAILGTIVYAIGALRWGAVGAVSSIAFAAAFDFAFMLMAALPTLKHHAVRISRPRIRIGADLLKFGAANLATASATYGVGVVVRAALLGSVIPSTAGLYHAAAALGGYWTVFFTNGIWASLHPSLVGAPADERRILLAASLRSLLLPTALLASVLIACRSNVLHILYSREFIAAAPLVAAQTIGDVALVLNLAIGVFFLTQERRVAYVSSQILPLSLLLLAGTGALDVVGPVVLPIAHAIGQGAALILQAIALGLDRALVRSLVLILCLLGVCALLPGYASLLGTAVLLYLFLRNSGLTGKARQE